ncbi:MAG: hypothetical protein JO224_13390 [Pelomonas sp.]|nr:hypothetical protein [Roseateles sp.]
MTASSFSMQQALRRCALLAGALVLGMLAIFVFTGVGQDPLQYVHPAADYARLLLADPPVLRATIGLDNLFIVAYGAVFVLMVSLAWRDAGARLLLGTALALLMGLALLDMVENFHFLAMLASAEQGHPPGDAEIAWQATESMLKFHVSYLGLCLLGLGLPRADMKQRLLAKLLVFVQWPVGVAIYVLPQSIAVPLVFVRFAFFLASFTLLAMIHRPQALPADAPLRDAGGSGARA